MSTFKSALACIILFLFQMSAFAGQAPSPFGNWKTIDDKTGQVKSIVKISGTPGYLSATVVKLYPGALTICSACSGNLKNKPILGMTVMYGLKQNPSNLSEWSGGTIFDPKTGKVYSCSLKVAPDGRSMVVRGYIGVSLLGRSQTWVKVK